MIVDLQGKNTDLGLTDSMVPSSTIRFFDNDTKIVGTCTQKTKIALFDINEWKKIPSVMCHPATLPKEVGIRKSVLLSNQHLLTMHADSIALWNLRSHTMQRFLRFAARIKLIKCTKGKQLCCAVLDNKSIVIIDLLQLQPSTTFACEQVIHAICFSADNTRLFAACKDGSILRIIAGNAPHADEPAGQGLGTRTS